MASSSSSLELNLSLKPSYVPKNIANLLKDLSHVHNDSKKLPVLNDYINQLEEELNSIVAFKRQLPQCMMFLMEALGALKDEFMKIKNGMESDETTGRQQDFVDFPGTKRKHYEKAKTDKSASAAENYAYKGKSLMSSNSCPHLRNYNNCENKRKKTFINFIQAQRPISFKESTFSLPSLADKGCNDREIMRGSHDRFDSVGTNDDIGQCGLNLRADDRALNYRPKPLTQPIWKNNRRSWSPELHSRFVEALNILGGIEVATPKQIREVMQVDGLTNDQVKSHLQKYRLYCRKLPEKYGDCSLVNLQDPWRPQIYYGDILSTKDSDDGNNSNNPQA